MRAWRAFFNRLGYSANFALSVFLEVRSVLSPNNWPHGLQNDSHLADALASHPAIHLLLPNGSIRKKKRMIKISIEVKSGAARFKVASQAESIEGALEIAKRYNSGKECKVVFPIDPEGFFVGDDLDRGGVVGKIAA
jgi:hypothetical protein